MNSTCGFSYLPAKPLLQPLWDFIRLREELLLSPLLPTLFALLVHLLFCTPFLALEVLGRRFPRLICFRISSAKTRPVDLRRWLDCLSRILVNYLTVVFTATALFQRLRSPTLPDVAPTVRRILLDVSLCLLLFDTLVFAWHILMHRIPLLYQVVHRTHHQHRETFALVAQDASAAELLSLQVLALTSASLVGCHPLSEVFFQLLNIWLAVEDHCGYDLPWALHRILPCFGGAPFHLAHHKTYRGNYAPYFRHWDWLCGTYLKEECCSLTS